MTDPREMGLRDTRRDDPARFLRELRELRSHAGLGLAELAARAHYPCDVIKAAETGPALPDLPVLSAYVRGCGGTVAEWEERWRAVTDSPASPLLTTRGTGWSEAADAGARVSGGSFPADDQDSDRVIAALNRVADSMTAASASAPPSGATASTARNADVWTPAGRSENADVWTPATAAGNADVWTPAGRSEDADVWTPAGRSEDADVWTPATPVPHTRRDAAALTADGRTAEPAAGAGGMSRSADAAARRPTASAGIPAGTGQPARPRPPAPSRTRAAYAAIALLLVVILIVLFA